MPENSDPSRSSQVCFYSRVLKRSLKQPAHVWDEFALHYPAPVIILRHRGEEMSQSGFCWLVGVFLTFLPAFVPCLQEFVDANPPQRNWKGIAISLLVIVIVCSLITLSVVLLTPCKSSSLSSVDGVVMINDAMRFSLLRSWAPWRRQVRSDRGGSLQTGVQRSRPRGEVDQWWVTQDHMRPNKPHMFKHTSCRRIWSLCRPQSGVWAGLHSWCHCGGQMST